MDRVDRLIMRASPKIKEWQRFGADNPYIGKNLDELFDMMSPESPDGYQAPEIRTTEWNKFIYALIHAASSG